MLAAHRARKLSLAHGHLDGLWRRGVAGRRLLEPRLLLWAAQRRSTSSGLWWGEAEREMSIAMLETALVAPTTRACHGPTPTGTPGRGTGTELDGPMRQQARALLAAHLAVASLHHPAEREMAALQRSVTNWMQLGVGTEAVEYERPTAASAVPSHIRKMAKRYDALRATLFAAARMAAAAAVAGDGSTGLHGLPCVVEDAAVEDAAVEDAAVEGAAVDDSAMEDAAVEAAGMEAAGMEGSERPVEVEVRPVEVEVALQWSLAKAEAPVPEIVTNDTFHQGDSLGVAVEAVSTEASAGETSTGWRGELLDGGAISAVALGTHAIPSDHDRPHEREDADGAGEDANAVARMPRRTRVQDNEAPVDSPSSLLA